MDNNVRAQTLQPDVADEAAAAWVSTSACHMKKRLIVCAMSTWIFTIRTVAFADTYLPEASAVPGISGNTSHTVTEPVLPPWQIRRQEFFQAIGALARNPQDASAMQAVDLALTGYEHNIGSRTPIEGMDLLGLWYLRRESIDKVMPGIVAEAVMGWSDVLQWASESGRAEIINNERFFLRTVLLSGNAQAAGQWTALLRENPDKARNLVDAGVYIANRQRLSGKLTYDHKWPAVYGLEPLVPAGEQSGSLRLAAPNLDDDAAWKEAVKSVKSYYLPGL